MSSSSSSSSSDEEGAIVVVDFGVFKMRLKGEGPGTILDVKEAVEEAIGIPVERQILTSSESEVLLDYQPLTAGDDIVLSLTVTPLSPHTKVSVTVSHHYEGFPYEEDFDVEETDTVIQLKQRIRASEEFEEMLKKVATQAVQDRFQPKHLKLMRTEDMEMKNDDFPLSKYYIHDGCIIDMFITKPEDEASTSTAPN